MQTATRTLTYRPGSLVILTGLPGAGKSTLLKRLYGLTGSERDPLIAGGTSVIDSGQARLTWASRLAWAPKQVRTAVVWTTHVSRIARALGQGRSVVAHVRGTNPLVLYGLARLSRRGGMHLILLEVDPDTAMAGQLDRGRVVSGRTFARHRRRYDELGRRVRRGEVSNAIILGRSAADLVESIVFTPDVMSPA